MEWLESEGELFTRDYFMGTAVRFLLARLNAGKVPKPCIDGVLCSRERRTDGGRARRCAEVQK